MEIRATTDAPAATAADTVAIGAFDGEDVAHDVGDGVLQALLDAGEAKTTVGHLALTHADGRRWLLVGLGAREQFSPETARTVAAKAHGRLRELGTTSLCWEIPHGMGDAMVEGFVEGTVLAAYRFERYRAPKPDAWPGVQSLHVSDHADRSVCVARARVLAESVNWARELMDTASNDMTPAAVAEAARAIVGVDCEVELGREALLDRGMGAFAAVSAGSAFDPALVTLRWEPAGIGDDAPLLALVGKAVTHDTGGLSIKPAATMHRMKYDMGGGAAVLGALRAIAALELPVRVLGVVGATENTIGPAAMKPGDVLRAMDGTTIEMNNADAEGRLVLADCMLHARALGARRLVDVATLTGGIVSALGGVFAGLFANDDGWAEALLAAGLTTGERLWRMPLDPGYHELVEGEFAQLRNSGEHKKAHAVQGAEFLHRFAGDDVPWAHLDIAGVGYDLGKPWAPKGASGFGVRLLVELAHVLATG